MDFDGIKQHFHDDYVKVHSEAKIETLDVAVVQGKIYLITVTKRINPANHQRHVTSIHIYEEQENKEFVKVESIVTTDQESGYRGPKCWSHYNKQYMLIENHLYYLKRDDGDFHLYKLNLIDKQTSIVKTFEVDGS